MSRRDTTELALALSYEESYGIKQLTARVVRVTADGLDNPRWETSRVQRGKEFDGFAVRAYIDSERQHAWGWRHHYAPHHVELDHAEVIVRVLRKIGKGLELAEREQGYAQDFATYVFRVASALGIRAYFTRNSDRKRAVTGQLDSRTDATGVQCWIGDQEQRHGKVRAE
ncbi:MAG: hypothetical protein ACRDR6_15395 [Pseudonocardiaceae bacterium]